MAEIPGFEPHQVQGDFDFTTTAPPPDIQVRKKPRTERIVPTIPVEDLPVSHQDICRFEDLKKLGDIPTLHVTINGTNVEELSRGMRCPDWEHKTQWAILIYNLTQELSAQSMAGTMAHKNYLSYTQVAQAVVNSIPATVEGWKTWEAKEGWARQTARKAKDIEKKIAAATQIEVSD